MKLRNKLLTVLPLTTIGVLSPVVISSCSCGSSYSIEYGNSINCKDKDNKDIKYHSIDSVKDAAKNHIQVATQGTVTPKSWSAETITETVENQEFFYWDLVYSLANANTAFTLVWNLDATTKVLTNGIYNGNAFTSLEYSVDDSKITIHMNGAKLVESYCYKDCTKA